MHAPTTLLISPPHNLADIYIYISSDTWDTGRKEGPEKKEAPIHEMWTMLSSSKDKRQTCQETPVPLLYQPIQCGPLLYQPIQCGPLPYQPRQCGPLLYHPIQCGPLLY